MLFMLSVLVLKFGHVQALQDIRSDCTSVIRTPHQKIRNLKWIIMLDVSLKPLAINKPSHSFNHFQNTHVIYVRPGYKSFI